MYGEHSFNYVVAGRQVTQQDMYKNCDPHGRGVLHQIFSNQVQHVIKNWTQSDLRFCKIERSKRSKINEKRGQLDRKSRKIIQNV